jgi:hypothetical protein
VETKQANLKRMDNMGIVVESLDEVIPFFEELGLKLEGQQQSRVNGLAALLG